MPFFVKVMIYYYLDETKTTCQFACVLNILDALAYDMFFVFVSNAIVTPLSYVIDIFHFIKVYKRKKLKESSEAFGLTQAEANQVFEGTTMYIASRYSSLIKTFWMAGLYASLMPICVPISATAIIISYYTDKYLILRRHSSPP